MNFKIQQFINDSFKLTNNCTTCSYCNCIVDSVVDFEDKASRIEWNFSQLCQGCQYKIFNKVEYPVC